MRHANTEHKDTLTKDEKIGLWVTKRVGTMTCAYVFAAIGVGSLVGVITGNAVLALACGALSSYFLQLVLLPIIAVGTNVQSKHDEVRADIRYEVDVKMEEDLLKIEKKLEDVENKIEKLLGWKI